MTLVEADSKLGGRLNLVETLGAATNLLSSTAWVEQELSKQFVFRALDRRIEIPPGVLYSIDGRTIAFRRDAIYGNRFGVVRIDREVIVVGPGSVLDVTIPE